MNVIAVIVKQAADGAVFVREDLIAVGRALPDDSLASPYIRQLIGEAAALANKLSELRQLSEGSE